MAETLKTKVLVIGGGPGGYVAAIRAGQLGLDTTIVEADKLGGTCLIRGCIPSKAVIHVAGEFEAMTHASDGKGRHGISLKSAPALDMPELVRWKEGIVRKLNTGVAALLKKYKVRVLDGWANFSDGKTCTVQGKGEPVTVTAEHVILANGSLPVELPFLPFGGDVISSTEALSLDALPEKLVVVGAGYIGLELGIALRKLGSEVTVVEALDRILPLYDAQLVEPVRKWLDRAGVALYLSAKAQRVEKGALVIETMDEKTHDVRGENNVGTDGQKPKREGGEIEKRAVALGGRFVK